jgi:hypothetical protein
MRDEELNPVSIQFGLQIAWSAGGVCVVSNEYFSPYRTISFRASPENLTFGCHGVVLRIFGAAWQFEQIRPC